MRTTYIVSYDIKHPKRLRRVHKCLLGWGDPLQYSVFKCTLTDSEKLKLQLALKALIHQRQDQVLLIDLGPETGRALTAISALGTPYPALPRQAHIL